MSFFILNNWQANLKDTGKLAADGRRHIWSDGKMNYDLEENWKPKAFTVEGPGHAHPDRVIVKDEKGITTDISPNRLIKR